MASWTTYKGLEVPDASTGDAGINLTDNLKSLADRFDTLLTVDGSAAAPSHSFTSDTNCGMYRITTDTIGMSTNGTERLRIDADGNVGVGTTSTTNIRLSTSSSHTATSGSFRGVNVAATLTPSGATSANLIGANVNITFAGANTSSSFCYGGRHSVELSSSGNINLVSGTYSDVFVTGSGTAFDVYGNYSQIYLFGSTGGISRGAVYYARTAFGNSASGTVGRLFHFHSVAASTGTGGASITNFAGICIESQTAATNNTYMLLGTNSVPSGNWGIYVTSTNNNYFAGKVGIANTSPSAQLTVSAGTNTTVGALVKGAASQSANLQEWQNSSGNILVQFDANGGAVFNEQGSSSADFRVEGDANQNLLFVDASADAIGIGTNAPNAAALMEFSSTTQGVLLPRMTSTQRDAISSAPAGLLVYNTTTNKLNFYNGSAWEAVTSS